LKTDRHVNASGHWCVTLGPNGMQRSILLIVFWPAGLKTDFVAVANSGDEKERIQGVSKLIDLCLRSTARATALFMTMAAVALPIRKPAPATGSG
jgi:hypothetical protein